MSGQDSGDLDLAALHDLAVEVDATRRLTRIAAEFVAEILNRWERITDRIDDLNGDDPGTGNPTPMEQIIDLSRVGDLDRDLLDIADRICHAIHLDPPSLGLVYDRRIVDGRE